MKVDQYRVKLRFSRLFPDPAIFDEPETLARRYLASTGVSEDKTIFIHQSAEHKGPLDDAGKPSVVSGEANFRYQGKMVKAEYMAGANISFDYADFGSGLTLAEHKERWDRGKWGELNFELRDLRHQSQEIDLPNIDELYRMIGSGQEATTMTTVDLRDIPDSLFDTTTGFIGSRLRELAKPRGETIEFYSGRQLTSNERAAIEKRLTRQLDRSSAVIILSRQTRDASIDVNE